MKKITNLVVVPLIAYAVFLSSPSFASSNINPGTPQNEIRHKTNTKNNPNPKAGIVGTVVSVSNPIITITTEEDLQYKVNTEHATIMKEAGGTNNPLLVNSSEIKTGDVVLIRGTISETET